MTNVTKLDDVRRLTISQLSEYKKAKSRISRKTEPHPLVKSEMTEGVFLRTKSILEKLISGNSGVGGLFEDKLRDGQLADGLGYEALQKYLTTTNDFLAKIKNADERRIARECTEELAIVKKYEFRYNRYHKNQDHRMRIV